MSSVIADLSHQNPYGTKINSDTVGSKDISEQEKSPNRTFKIIESSIPNNTYFCYSTKMVQTTIPETLGMFLEMSITTVKFCDLEIWAPIGLST